ncbi:hypothetical protein HUG10_21365 (plasmid) [Halorarum halophilum]|uniref:Mannose-1-phosphate guanyltransferase C-terminal domain-containing protein n=1 Tax=Halorarum halophilum TaxID=2743090 RepID=A0A7D5KAV8_9EURY|nr:NDP-sugar synthase [Halobaculum halophilum]QLG30139.1 hypothetical protein HUG10_21365 [Halobaculum halophilum]
MQAVIDATGNVSSLSPINDRRSHFTLPVAGKTVIEHVVDTLVEIGVERIAIVTDEDSLRTVFGAERGVDRLATEDVELCFVKHYYVDRAAKTNGLASDSGFLWVRGDILYDQESLAELAEHDAAIGHVNLPTAGVHGRLEFNGDRVRARPGDIEHSGAHMAYAYKFPAEAHEWDYGIDPMTIELADTHSPEAVLVDWTPITNPNDYLEANLAFAARQEGGDIVWAESSLDEGLAQNCVITGPCVIGEDVTIEPGAIVESSVILDGATIGAGSYVGHSVIGEGATVEQNVTTNTRAASGETIVAEFDGERIDTGRTEFGAIVGPGATVQAGVTIRRGTTVDTGLTVDPGETV